MGERIPRSVATAVWMISLRLRAHWSQGIQRGGGCRNWINGYKPLPRSWRVRTRMPDFLDTIKTELVFYFRDICFPPKVRYKDIAPKVFALIHALCASTDIGNKYLYWRFGGKPSFGPFGVIRCPVRDQGWRS